MVCRPERRKVYFRGGARMHMSCIFERALPGTCNRKSAHGILGVRQHPAPPPPPNSYAPGICTCTCTCTSTMAYCPPTIQPNTQCDLMLNYIHCTMYTHVHVHKVYMFHMYIAIQKGWRDGLAMGYMYKNHMFIVYYITHIHVHTVHRPCI